MPVTVYRRGKPFTPPQWEEMEGPPALLLKPLPQALINEVVRSGGKISNSGEEADRIIKAALVGWIDVVDEDGHAIAFNADKIDEMVDLLEGEIRIEVFKEAISRYGLTKADRKNFGSASSSAPSSSPDTTAQTVEAPEVPLEEKDSAVTET